MSYGKNGRILIWDDELWKKWKNINMGNPLKALGNS